MSMSWPVEAVVQYLEQKGYSLRPNSILVRGITFSFDATLKAPDRFSDLILVCDVLEQESEHSLVRQILGLARALDMAEKTNPLTTILVGGRLTAQLTNRLMGVTRVLTLGSFETPEEANTVLENGLAILTPLKLGEADNGVVDPVASLRLAVTNLGQNALNLIEIADEGSDSVKDAIDRLLDIDLSLIWEETE